jgi:hypothetical protein
MDGEQHTVSESLQPVLIATTRGIVKVLESAKISSPSVSTNNLLSSVVETILF